MSADNVKGNRNAGFLQTVRALATSVGSTEQGQDMAAQAVTAGLGLLAKGLDAQAAKKSAQKAEKEAAAAQARLHADSAAAASVFTPEGQLNRSRNIRPTAPTAPKTFEQQLYENAYLERIVSVGEQAGIPREAYFKETPNALQQRLLTGDRAKLQATVNALQARLSNLEAQEKEGGLDESRMMQKAQLQDVVQDAAALLALPVPTQEDWAKRPQEFKSTLEAVDALVAKRGIVLQPPPDAPGSYRQETWALYTLQANLVTVTERIEQMTRPDGPPNPMMGGMGVGMMGGGGMMPGMFPGMFPGMMGAVPPVVPGAPVSPAEAERTRDRDLARAQSFHARADGPSGGYSGPTQAELMQQDWLQDQLNKR